MSVIAVEFKRSTQVTRRHFWNECWKYPSRTFHWYALQHGSALDHSSSFLAGFFPTAARIPSCIRSCSTARRTNPGLGHHSSKGPYRSSPIVSSKAFRHISRPSIPPLLLSGAMPPTQVREPGPHFHGFRSSPSPSSLPACKG